MWALDNHTPFAAERTWLRDKSGAHRWMVAIKATFTLEQSGKVSIADEQLPVLHAPEFYGNPESSSVRYESDLVLDKPTTDILLNGHAYAPRGLPLKKLDVSLRVGPVFKTLVVYGMRVYCRGLTGLALSSPVEFVKRHLTYEWAYGGMDLSPADNKRRAMDARNPAGKGVTSNPSGLLDKPGHSIEYPSGTPSRVGPAGFGAIASHWSPRREWAGTYDSAWEANRKPLMPLDYDERHVLCAPVDQQSSAHLQGGENVELIHLTPSGVLRFALPRVTLRIHSFFGSKHREQTSRLATVLLEPDEGRLIMLWQSSLSVPEKDAEYLDVARIEATLDGRLGS